MLLITKNPIKKSIFFFLLQLNNIITLSMTCSEFSFLLNSQWNIPENIKQITPNPEDYPPTLGITPQTRKICNPSLPQPILDKNSPTWIGLSKNNITIIYHILNLSCKTYRINQYQNYF